MVFPIDIKHQCLARPDIERHPVVAHREVMYSGIIDDEVRFKASVRMDGDYGGSAFISYVIVRINQYGSESQFGTVAIQESAYVNRVFPEEGCLWGCLQDSGCYYLSFRVS